VRIASLYMCVETLVVEFMAPSSVGASAAARSRRSDVADAYDEWTMQSARRLPGVEEQIGALAFAPAAAPIAATAAYVHEARCRRVRLSATTGGGSGQRRPAAGIGDD